MDMMTWARWLETDLRLSRRLQVAERPGPLRELARFLAHSGDSWFWGLGLLAVWLRGDVHQKLWAVNSVVGIAVTAVLVMAIKFAVRRRRPEGQWGAIYRKTDPHSFPSGHAARAVMLAVLAIALGPEWLAAVLLLWAPLVGLARIAMGVHYLSDVVAGGALGLAVGIVLGLYFNW